MSATVDNSVAITREEMRALIKFHCDELARVAGKYPAEVTKWYILDLLSRIHELIAALDDIK